MIEARDEETIIAQCTPSGSGAIALLRISGNQAIPITQQLGVLVNKKELCKQPTHTIHYGYIIGQNKKIIDHVLFLLMRAPQTFTGQDTVEITCHNNPFIIDSIIQLAIKNGARIAERGEFTKRAFLNKKIDLAQAESINELIHAHTEQALQKSMAQLEGSLSHWFKKLEDQLLQAHGLCEASFEFLEEDISFDINIQNLIKNTIDEILEIEKQYNQQQQIKDGFRVTLIGTVNAGKSSLFNKLVKAERAIVTEIAGTTRDVIEAGIYRDHSYITFVDTAGLRETNEQIEQEGIKRSFNEAEKADIILLLSDSSQLLSTHESHIYQKLSDKYKEKIIHISSKIDLKKEFNLRNNTIKVSTLTEEGIAQLEFTIKSKIAKQLDNLTSPYLLNTRQIHLLQHLKNDLQITLTMTEKPLEHELISIHLKDALQNLTELTGKTLSESSINKVFEQFCIGK